MHLLQINRMTREDAERSLSFAGFLVFHCPLKEDAAASIKMLADSSHRVRQKHSYSSTGHIA